MSRGFVLLIYGETGIGKTSIACHAPQEVKCISIMETGCSDLLDMEIIPDVHDISVRTWDEFMKEVKNCNQKTLVIDNLSGMQSILFRHVIEEDFEGSQERFYDFWRGPRMNAPRFWPELEYELMNLREKGTNIILLAHLKVEEKPNPIGKNYLYKTIDMDKGVGSEILKWAQNVFMFDMCLDQDTVLTGKQALAMSKPVTLKDTETRIAYCTKAPAHDAKNRMNLPPVITLGDSAEEGWMNLYKHFPDIYKN